MADTTGLDLTVENLKLQQQIDSNKVSINGFLAQLDAHKGLINDIMPHNLQLRTNVILLQKQAQEYHDKIIALEKTIENLTQKLAEKTLPVV